MTIRFKKFFLRVSKKMDFHVSIRNVSLSRQGFFVLKNVSWGASLKIFLWPEKSF